MPTKKQLEDENKELFGQLEGLKSELYYSQNKLKNKETTGVPYVQKDKKFTIFDGSCDDVSEWFEEIESFVFSRFNNEEEAVRFIMEKLPKKVQRELKFLLDWDSITVNKVKEHLYEVFGVSASVTLLQEKFFGRNQLKDEDVMLYSHVLVD